MGSGRRDDSLHLIAAALGALAGLRSMAAPALLSHEFTEEGGGGAAGTVGRLLTGRTASRLLALLASGEMIADKSGAVGNRTDPIPLLGRVVIGAFTAGTYARSRRTSVLLPAIVGGTAAIGSAYAAFHLRRLAAERFDLPDRFVGLVEDAIVVGASRGLAEAIER